MTRTISVIIVSHNSAGVLPQCLACLDQQTVPIASTVVVDSGSANRDYLHDLKSRYSLVLIETANIGFSRANNLGYSQVPATADCIIFLNPDTFLPADWLERALRTMDAHPQAAIVTGVLEGYDPETDQPTGHIDSTGIFRRWYGRWYDRDQGRKVGDQMSDVQYVPAACGALLCCRREALEGFAGTVFDPDFFLYKEDIELSLRLRKHGWKIVFDPKLTAYHCRGWQTKRKEMPQSLRKIAAESEVVLYKKHPSPYMLWALIKYSLVRFCNF